MRAILRKEKNSPFSERRRLKQGYTLVETLMALMIFSLLTALAFSSLYFFNQLRNLSDISGDTNQQFEKIHLYFQRQIETSESIKVKDGRVFLQDMESPQYYNCYELKSTGMLYRVKTKSSLKPIGGGESSQFEKGLQSFDLKALTDREGRFSGVFLLRVVFNDETDKNYETYITYPGQIECIVSE